MKLKSLALLAAACMLSGLGYAQDDLRAQASFYVNTYGLVDTKKHPLAVRAYAIFKRIKQVAEDPIVLTPTLKVINSRGRPWAVALPDGYIILSKAALDVCYHNVNMRTGDARLAFVLGHELAHLTSNDFWHRKIYLALSGEQNDRALKKIRHAIVEKNNGTRNWREVIKRKELQADDAGFLYASLAGYRTDAIFKSTGNSQDFLTTWVNQTRTIQDDLHFNAKERSAFLLNRFQNITAKVEYFQSGVRLAHFGRFEDALHFFEKFQHAFPSHEVLNNLGYVHLQLARKYMPDAIRYRYWLPTFMDNAPAFALKTRTMDNHLPKQSQRHLGSAIKLLRKASMAHSNNLTSRINLASAYLYLGKYHKARAQIEEAREFAPGNPRVRELRAIIIYEQEKDIDMWPMAVQSIKKVANAVRPTTYFNLARLFEERGRVLDARRYWRKLVILKQRVPIQIYHMACRKIPNSESCLAKIPGKPVHAPFRTRISPGASIDARNVQKRLATWQHRHEEIGPLPVDLFISRHGDSYLAVDDVVALAVIKNHNLKTVRKLLACCGKPLGIHSLGESRLWSYGNEWSALVDGDTVREIWIKGS